MNRSSTPPVWAQAQAILDARGESHAHRAASGSDYVLTGRLRCPQCGKPMVGTRATGRNKTYRYYTCWNLARYDAACLYDGHRDGLAVKGTEAGGVQMEISADTAPQCVGRDRRLRSR